MGAVPEGHLRWARAPLRSAHRRPTDDGPDFSWRVERRAADSDLILVRLPLAAHYQGEGRLDEARQLVSEIRAVNPDLTAETAAIGMPGVDGPNARELARQLRRVGMP